MDAAEDFARIWINENKKKFVLCQVGRGCEVFPFETYECFKFVNELSKNPMYKILFIHDRYVVAQAGKAQNNIVVACKTYSSNVHHQK